MNRKWNNSIKLLNWYFIKFYIIDHLEFVVQYSS